MNKKHLLLLIVLILLASIASPSYAQTDDSSIRFRYLGQEDGLSTDRVRAIIQDDQGFMWFGHWDGLTRYDGHTTVVFRNDFSTGHR